MYHDEIRFSGEHSLHYKDPLLYYGQQLLHYGQHLSYYSEKFMYPRQQPLYDWERLLYCCRRELGGQHAFHTAPAIENNPLNLQLFSNSDIFFVKHQLLPATEETMVLDSPPEALFVPAAKKTGSGTVARKDFYSLRIFSPHSSFKNH